MYYVQGVSCSQKFCGKCNFTNLAKGRTSQFMFPKYLIEYPKCKVMKSKFESEKNNKNKHQSNVVLKENKKKRHWNRLDVCYATFKYLFPYFMYL